MVKRVVRMAVVVTVLLLGGGFAAIILLGPQNVRWLIANAADHASGSWRRTSYPRGIPEIFIVELRRGVLLATQHRYEEALVSFDKAVRASTNANTLQTLGARAANSTLPETHLWQLDIQLRMARADALLRIGRYEEALGDISYAVALNERHFANRYQRGVALMLAEKHTEAIFDFDAVLAMRNDVTVLFARGLAKYMSQDWTGAAGDFKRASGFARDNLVYQAWLAEAEAQSAPSMPAAYRVLAPDDIMRALSHRSAAPETFAQGSRPLSGK